MMDAKSVPEAKKSANASFIDRILLASWIASYAILLFGFGLLKRLEDVKGRRKLPKVPGENDSNVYLKGA